MRIVIEPLGEQHQRADFTCGEPELDNWLRHRARQDDRLNKARVFVAADAALDVMGFYSLSSFTLSLDNAPEEIARIPSKYDAIPAALIERLARDARVRGQGVGELLLADAVRRILGAGKTLAVFAIVVEAKDRGAVDFYKEFGFQGFPLRPDRMFLLTSTATAAIEKI